MPRFRHPGYFVRIVSEYPADTDYCHVLCGKHSVRGARCPNCHKPLQRLLQLDTRDPRLGLMGSPSEALPLLFCWCCPAALHDFVYQVLPDACVRVLRHGRGEPVPDFPYEDYPVFFPESPVILVPLTPHEQSVIHALNVDGCMDYSDEDGYLNDTPHQVLGEPRFWQPENAPDCVICRRPMELLASIGDECADPRGIVGTSGVQVIYHRCRRCFTVTAQNRAD